MSSSIQSQSPVQKRTEAQPAQAPAQAPKPAQASPAAAPAAKSAPSAPAARTADAFKQGLKFIPQSQAQRAATAPSLFSLRQAASAGAATAAPAAPPSPQMQALQNSAGYKGLSAAQQKQALDVFNNTSIDGRRDLVTLADRTIGSPPKSALLDVDAKGGTLLDGLQRLATGPIDERFAQNGITRESLLASTIQEAASPGQINQSCKGTCTVTSMQYLLCKQNPAEYVRLAQGLLGPSGQVQLRNGDTLKRVEDSIANDAAWDRSTTERVFQSAMMDYSNGFLKYSNTQDKSNLLPGVGMGGLIDPQMEKGLQGLFGKNFSRVPPLWKAFWGQQDVIDTIKNHAKDGGVLISMGWGEKKFLGIPEGGHALIGTRVENDRVYFRNPWGPTGDAVGTTYQNPPRRLEDPAIREESMSVADFKKWVWSAFAP